MKASDADPAEFMVDGSHVEFVARIVGVDGIEVAGMSNDESFEEYSLAEYLVDDERPPSMSRGLRRGELA